MGLSISPFILLFPVYKINVFFGLRGKLALIFPYIATSISFNTLLLVGYLKSLPTEIDEAAIIDGATLLHKGCLHLRLRPGIRDGSVPEPTAGPFFSMSGSVSSSDPSVGHFHTVVAVGLKYID